MGMDTWLSPEQRARIEKDLQKVPLFGTADPRAGASPALDPWGLRRALTVLVSDAKGVTPAQAFRVYEALGSLESEVARLREERDAAHAMLDDWAADNAALRAENAALRQDKGRVVTLREAINAVLPSAPQTQEET